MEEQTLVVWSSSWMNLSSELALAFASAACNNESVSVALVEPLQSSTEKKGRKCRYYKNVHSYHVHENI
jgi:hypothetical protein